MALLYHIEKKPDYVGLSLVDNDPFLTGQQIKGQGIHQDPVFERFGDLPSLHAGQGSLVLIIIIHANINAYRLPHMQG